MVNLCRICNRLMECTEPEGLFFRDAFGDRPVLHPIYSCVNSNCVNYTGSLKREAMR